uniref:Protein kinase domain-containing protein n=1 Tax=Periophthalmus magnuspinnatus TaxID=409849 RepID=A0A3B3ZWI1_9GOBI
PTGDQEDEPLVPGWRGFLSSVGLSLPASVCRLAPPGLRLGHRRMLQGKAPDIPEHVLRLAGVGPDKLRAEWNLPGFITMFLPEFPHRTVSGQEHFQVMSYIAKGSFGPILKVKDKVQHKTYAVIPKSEILRLGVLEQSKEEVIVQVHHPFVHDLQDCWQTQRHLYICDYCSTGDLYTYWQMNGQFSEDTVRVFAAELGCALFLHDIGVIHRDVKMENILLTDNFPVPPEPDHCSMLRKVRHFPYEMPLSFSPPLALLISEILKLRERPDRAAKARRGLTLSLQPLKGFDYDALLSPDTPDTQDNSTQTRTTIALPGPPLQPAQEKGPRREIFV